MSGTEERNDAEWAADLADLAAGLGSLTHTPRTAGRRIVAAVPSLLSECERLQAENAELRGENERLTKRLEFWWSRLDDATVETWRVAAELAAVRRVVQAAEGAAKIEAAKHQPEPGGCTCGFCAFSIEHVVVMSVRAALADPVGLPTTDEPARGLHVMEAHAAADCPDRAACWAREIHDAHAAALAGPGPTPEPATSVDPADTYIAPDGREDATWMRPHRLLIESLPLPDETKAELNGALDAVYNHTIEERDEDAALNRQLLAALLRGPGPTDDERAATGEQR